MADRHCPTCICGRRAPVQGTSPSRQREPGAKGPGTVSWGEHLQAYATYANRYGTAQSAERIAERAGFSYSELINLLGHEPTTWQPVGREVQL